MEFSQSWPNEARLSLELREHVQNRLKARNKKLHRRKKPLQSDYTTSSTHEEIKAESEVSRLADEQVRWLSRCLTTVNCWTQIPDQPTSNVQVLDKPNPRHQREVTNLSYFGLQVASEKATSFVQFATDSDIMSTSSRRSRKAKGPSKPRVFTLAIVVVLALALAGGSAYQLTNNLIANNLPPKFITSTGGAGSHQASNSEIVVRVKEGPSSIGRLIYTLKGEDPDEDPLTFGVLGSTASDLLRIENLPGNQANVFLRKELDRETTESYQVVITLTDGKLGRGNWVSIN